MSNLNAIKISESVYWVGAIDWNIRYFHGYATLKGTTYNAYLVMADKITLIDGVKKGFECELLERVASVVDPQKIEYIVSNHAEPDHSGGIAKIAEIVKPEKIFASKGGVRALAAYYPELQVEAVADGGELSLGNRTLKFMETKMLHWPDSMFSYLAEEEVLFSQDAFGMHLATSERFDDELPWSLLEEMSTGYYANIITLYSPFVQNLLKKVAASGLTFKVVAPDHGPVWRNMDNFVKMLGFYDKWSARRTDKKAVIVYDSMWHSTEKMARYIEDGLASQGIKVKSLFMQSSDRSEVAAELLDASALIVGSPTINNELFPSVADVMCYLKGLKFKTPFAAAFGSYGWSGESIKYLSQMLTEMCGEVVGSVKALYTPTEEIKTQCFELGREIGEKINNKN